MLMSIVPGHTGYCEAVWVNRNEVLQRLDGGVTGDFRKVVVKSWWPFYVRTGPVFHGIVRNRNPGVVEPTSWK